MVSSDFKKALEALIGWEDANERDSYPYFKQLFVEGFGYSVQQIKIDTRGLTGIPDIVIIPEDSSRPWIVAEVKPEKGRFMERAD